MSLSDAVIAHALANPVNRQLIAGLNDLALPDCWIVSGCVFQSVWNGLTGRDPRYGILDYDVFYCDPDTSWDAEDSVIQRCAEAFSGLGVEVQVRNQARVHLWYPEKFGRPYPPVATTAEALSRFLAPACAVGLRLGPAGPVVAAPFGLTDLAAMTIRRNPAVSGSAVQYDVKTARWKAMWPEIVVHPWGQ